MIDWLAFNFRVWWPRLLVTYGLYQVNRILFLTLNLHEFSHFSFKQLIWSFAYGFRFDFSAIATVFLPAWIIEMVGVGVLYLVNPTIKLANDLRMQRWSQIVGALYGVFTVVLLGIGVIDSRMFSFTGRRTSPEIFYMLNDIMGQSLGVLKMYWFLTIPSLLAAYLLVRFCMRIPQVLYSTRQVNRRLVLASAFLMVIVSALGVRGGLQRKPLAPAHAFAFQPSSYANLILNSTITLLKSPPADLPKQYHDFSPETCREILAISSFQESAVERIPLLDRRNIVVIIVESLGAEYVGSMNKGIGYTPFLDELIQESVSFRYAFANGRRSIDAMPAIFASIPAWRDQPFVTSPFQGNNIEAMPKVLKNAGYETAFFHGGENGTMHFDTFSALVGFENYFGLNEYPRHGDHDGAWGIFDEPFLIFSAERMSQMKEPFMAGIFTLSSHNPFPVPEKYRNRFSKGSLPIHEAIGYADYSLRSFFDVARQMPWFSRTLFIITGDHTSLSRGGYYSSVLGRYHVPLIFYDPQKSLPLIGQSKPAQHVDITPTVLELLGIFRQKPKLFGGPLFAPEHTGRFVQFDYGSWFYWDLDVGVRIDGEDKASFYDAHDSEFLNERVSEAEDINKLQFLKASRQYFNQGLIGNSW